MARRARSANVTAMPSHLPHHVVIAGGGVAALETLMALRAHAGADDLPITLLAPDRDFRYRPMAVAEPFSIARAHRLALADIAAEFDAELVTGALDAVDAKNRFAVTPAGFRIGYDALVIACGTRMRPALEGAVTVDDRNLGETLRGLVRDIEQGYTKEVAFVAPAQAFWPLPLYELALLTAQRAYDMGASATFTIVSPESAPLTVFGSAVSRELSRLLRDAGIAFRGSSFAQLAHGRLTLSPGGEVLTPQRVVAMPLLDGPQIAGVPADPQGFIPTAEHGEVRGLHGVYAAGDVTTYPIKHGGLAAQQADTVAARIAARAGLAADADPPQPVIRGVLMTGGPPRYLEAELTGAAGFSSSVSDVCPWAPAGKLVARHLGPYLADGGRRRVAV
jgi:sulfide:quinone oxidoreductase